MIKAEKDAYPEGLKSIVRELSFAGDSENFGGWCFCGLLQIEKCREEVSNIWTHDTQPQLFIFALFTILGVQKTYFLVRIVSLITVPFATLGSVGFTHAIVV